MERFHDGDLKSGRSDRLVNHWCRRSNRFAGRRNINQLATQDFRDLWFAFVLLRGFLSSALGCTTKSHNNPGPAFVFAKRRDENLLMSSEQDPARLIAERVARRLAGERSQRPAANHSQVAAPLTPSRARMIDFISPAAPAVTTPSIKASIPSAREPMGSQSTSSAPPTQSPWLAPFSHAMGEPFNQKNSPQSAVLNSQLIEHASQERFGVEEAAVSELVEFFENEKHCSVDPSGKPCDHCAMCSSRGF